MRKVIVCVFMAWSLSVATSRAWGEAAPRQAAPPATAPAADPLDRVCPEINFDRVSLNDAIDFLRDATGARIFVDWGILSAAGVNPEAAVSAHLTNVKFQAVLDVTLASAAGARGKLGYAVRDGIIWVSTVQDLSARPREPRLPRGNRADDNAAAQKLLDRRLPEMKFEGNGLADVIDFLRDVTGAKIFVNWPALEAAGVKKDQAVSLSMKDVSVSQSLLMILERAAGTGIRLEYAVEDGVITISTRQDFDSQVVTRKYPVFDLIQSPAFAPAERALIARVRSTVDPGTWDGPGKAEVVGFDLVVTATPENQQRVRKLLEELRGAVKRGRS